MYPESTAFCQIGILHWLEALVGRRPSHKEAR
jgi:hypothetical protein